MPRSAQPDLGLRTGQLRSSDSSHNQVTGSGHVTSKNASSLRRQRRVNRRNATRVDSKRRRLASPARAAVSVLLGLGGLGLAGCFSPDLASTPSIELQPGETGVIDIGSEALLVAGHPPYTAASNSPTMSEDQVHVDPDPSIDANVVFTEFSFAPDLGRPCCPNSVGYIQVSQPGPVQVTYRAVPPDATGGEDQPTLIVVATNQAKNLSTGGYQRAWAIPVAIVGS